MYRNAASLNACPAPRVAFESVIYGVPHLPAATVVGRLRSLFDLGCHEVGAVNPFRRFKKFNEGTLGSDKILGKLHIRVLG